MQKEQGDEKFIKFFSLKRILIPVLIGIAITFFMVVKDFSKPVFTKVESGKGDYVWTDLDEDGTPSSDEYTLAVDGQKGDYIQQTQPQLWRSIIHNWKGSATFAMLMAVLMVFLRDFFYMYRIRLLTDKELSWKRAFQVIMLWEFSSALTPSVVGGSAVALFIVSKEGIAPGRSTSIVLITALLDELFYILMVPIVFLLIGHNQLFIKDFNFTLFGKVFGMQSIFIIGFAFICLLTMIILWGVFIKPVKFKRLLIRICSIKFLRRWRKKAAKMGDDVIITSRQLRNKPFSFWAKAYGSTLISWTARFGVVNFLLMAFNPVNNHLLVYGRQLVMWVILLISPTPGGSGIAEFAFPIFLKEFIPAGTASALAMLWRLLTYYPYIIVGAIILPIWLRQVFKKTANPKV